MEQRIPLRIHYGDFILIQSGGKYLSILPEFDQFEDNKASNNFVFRSPQEFNVLDINYFLFMILPSDENLVYTLFAENFSNPIFKYSFNKEKVFQRLSDKFKIQDPVLYEKEVRLFNPFFCTFLSYNSKDKGEIKTCKSNIYVDGSNDWSSLFKLKCEFQRNRQREIYHDLSISFQASEKGDYSSLQFLSLETDAEKNISHPVIKSFKEKGTAGKKKDAKADGKSKKSELASKLMFVNKFMSFLEYRNCRFMNNGKRFVTPIDYTRFFTNVGGDEYFVASMQSSWEDFQNKATYPLDLSLVSKEELSKWNFLSIFQFNDHENFSFRNSRLLSMYSYPYSTAEVNENDKLYPPKPEFHYTIHLPLNIWNFEKKEKKSFESVFPYTSYLSRSQREDLEIKFPVNGKADKNSKMFVLNKIDEVQPNSDYWESVREDTTFYIGYLKKEDQLSGSSFIRRDLAPKVDAPDLILKDQNFLFDIDGYNSVIDTRTRIQQENERRRKEYEEKKEKLVEKQREQIEILKGQKLQELEEKASRGEIIKPEGGFIVELKEEEKPPLEQIEDFQEVDESNLFVYDEYFSQYACNEYKAKMQNPKLKSEFNTYDQFSFNFNEYADRTPEYELKLESKLNLQFECIALNENEVLDIFRIYSLKKMIYKLLSGYNDLKDFGNVNEKIKILNIMLENRMKENPNEENPLQHNIFNVGIPQMVLDFLFNHFEDWKRFNLKSQELEKAADEEAKLAAAKEKDIEETKRKEETKGAKANEKDVVKPDAVHIEMVGLGGEGKDKGATDPKAENDAKGKEDPTRPSGKGQQTQGKDGKAPKKGEENVEPNEKNEKAKVEEQEKVDTIAPIIQRDEFIEFFKNISSNNMVIKNWLLEKIDILFDLSKYSPKIQAFTLNSVLKNNKLLESAINLEKVNNLFNKLTNIMRYYDDSSKNVILNIYNELYKDISLIHPGSSLATYLNYLITPDHISNILIKVFQEEITIEKPDNKAEESKNLVPEKKLVLRISDLDLNNNFDMEFLEALTETQKLETESFQIVMQKLALTYHLLRSPNVYFFAEELLKKNNPSFKKEEMFQFCLSIAKNHKLTPNFRAQILEYISTIFFHGALRLFPPTVKYRNKIPTEFDSRVKEMHTIFLDACKGIATDYEIIKVLVQKRMIQFNITENICEQFIREFLDNYKAQMSNEKLDEDVYDMLSKTLARLCELYKIELTKNIKDQFINDNYRIHVIKNAVENNVMKRRSTDIQGFLTKSLDLKSTTRDEISKKITNISKFSVNLSSIFLNLNSIIELDMQNPFDIFKNWELLFENKVKLEMSMNDKSARMESFVAMKKSLTEIFDSVLKIVGNNDSNKFISMALKDDDFDYKALDQIFVSKLKPAYLKASNPQEKDLIESKPLSLVFDSTNLSEQEIIMRKEKLINFQSFLRESEMFRDFVDLFIFLMRYQVFDDEMHISTQIQIELLKLIVVFLDRNPQNAELIADYITNNEFFLQISKLFSRFFHIKRALCFVFLIKIYSTLKLNNEITEIMSGFIISFISELNLYLENTIYPFIYSEYQTDSKHCLKCHTLAIFVIRSSKIMIDNEIEGTIIFDTKKMVLEAEALENKLFEAKKIDYILSKLSFQVLYNFERHVYNDEIYNKFNSYDCSYYSDIKRTEIIQNYLKETAQILKKYKATSFTNFWMNAMYYRYLYYSMYCHTEYKVPYYYHKLYFHMFQIIMDDQSAWNESLNIHPFSNSFFAVLYSNTGMSNIENKLRENIEKFMSSAQNSDGTLKYQRVLDKFKEIPDLYELRSRMNMCSLSRSALEKIQTSNPNGYWPPEIILKYIRIMLSVYTLKGFEKIIFYQNSYCGSYGIYSLTEIAIIFLHLIFYIKEKNSDFDVYRVDIVSLINEFYSSNSGQMSQLIKDSGDDWTLDFNSLLLDLIKQELPENNQDPTKINSPPKSFKYPAYQLLKGKETQENESHQAIQIEKTLLTYCEENSTSKTLLEYEKIFEGINSHDRILEYSKKIFEFTKTNIRRYESELCMLIDITYATLYFYIEKKISQKYKSNLKEEEKIGQVIDLNSKAMQDLHKKLILDQNIFNSIYKILEKTNSSKVLVKTLRLANKLLEFTNRDVQTIFYDKFVSDDYNRVLTNLMGFLRAGRDILIILETKTGKDLVIENLERFSWSEFKKYGEANRMVNSILLYFKMLCEGHFDEMQAFLFEQKQEGEIHENPMNVVEILVKEVMDPYISICKPSNFELGFNILQVLIEVIQGDVGEFTKDLIRQDDLLNLLKKFYKALQSSYELTKDKYLENNLPTSKLNSAFNLKVTNIRKIMQVIQSIIENSTKIVIHDILEGIDWIFILEQEIKSIRNFLENQKINDRKDKESFIKYQISESDFQSYCTPLTDFTVIKSTIEAIDPIFETELRKKFESKLNLSKTVQEDLEKASKQGIQYDEIQGLYQTLQEYYICSVEIVNEAKDLKVVYFPKPVICRYLTHEMKDILIKKVDRTNYQTKIAEFLGQKDIVKAELNNKYERNLTKVSKVLYVFESFAKQLHFIISILLCALLLWAELADLNLILNNDWDVRFQSDFSKTFYALVFVEIALSLIIFLFFCFSSEYYYEYLARWDRYAQKARKDYGSLTEGEILSWAFNPENISNDDFMRLFRTMGPKNPFFLISKKWKTNIYLNIVFTIVKLKHLFSSFKLFRYVMYLLFSGLILYHPVFTPLVLLIKLFEYTTVTNVLLAFSTNWKVFGVTICFGLCILMIYSAIGYYALRDIFFVYDDGAQKNICQTISMCFLSLINYGIRSGGGIGDEIYHIYRSHWYKYAGRWVFDFTFFVLIIVLLMNLIFGVIIDTFKDINKKQEDDINDQVNNCFICNLEKETINQKIKAGFDVHVKKDHYMWNYIFYLIYLDKKGVMELSSLESDVWDQFKNKKFDWIPYHRTIKLEDEVSAEKIELQNTFSNLENLNDIVNELYKSSKFEDMIKNEKKIEMLTKRLNTLTEMNVRSSMF